MRFRGRALSLMTATCYNHKLPNQNTKRRKQECQKEDTFKLASSVISHIYLWNTKQNIALQGNTSTQPKETTKLEIIHLFTFKTIYFMAFNIYYIYIYICTFKKQRAVDC